MKKTLLCCFVAGLFASTAQAEELDSSPQFGAGASTQAKPLYNNGKQENNYMPPVSGTKKTQPNNVVFASAPQGGVAQTATTAYEDREPLTRKQVRDRAFEEFVEENTPFTEEQLRQLNGIKEGNAKAQQESTRTPPRPVADEATVSFDIGSDIPVISLDSKNVTTLLFTDKNNYRWEILSAKVGDESGFQAHEPIKDVQTNAVSLTTTKLSGITNLSVWLRDAPAPLMFTLVAGQDKVNYVFNVKVANDGPNTPVLENFDNKYSGKEFNDSDDFKLLKQGVIPKGLKALKMKGNISGRAEAYASRNGQDLYVRTNMKLIAPEPTGGGRLLDGDWVYRLPKAEIISFMYEGRVQDVIISGFPAVTYK